MDIINKSYSLYLTCAFVFVLCCSMSHCKDITPGPLTTVHGTVKDYTTGNPVANVKLQVVQTTGGSFSSFFGSIFSGVSGTHDKGLDTIVTKAYGTYNLSF